MRIAINALPSSGYGGITYLKYLLPVLDRREEDHAWFVYGRRPTLESIRFSSERIRFQEVDIAGGLPGRVFWEQVFLPRLIQRDQIDIVYTANNTDLFFAPRPRVNAIRYTEPFRYRLFHNSPSKRVRCEALRLLTWLSLRSADHVICCSDYARRVVSESYPYTNQKCTIIHHGLQPNFFSQARRPAWAPDRFLFAAAKMIGYANLHNLIEAYGLCRARGLDSLLIIAGGPHDSQYEQVLKRQIHTLGLSEKIRFPGYISQENMAWLYANATVFVFSSLLEACPNTLIEALGCGAAIVSSDTEPNREIAGAAADWCDGHSPTSMASSIQRVAGDPEHSSRLRSAALRQARQYSWERTADALVQTLTAVHRNCQGSHRAAAEPKACA